NQKSQKGIQLIEDQWNQRKHLAFLSSGSLWEVTEKLDQFELYLGMIDSQFINNTAVLGNVFEYFRGMSADKKMAFSQVVDRAKAILAQERKKLAQAMLGRL